MGVQRLAADQGRQSFWGASCPFRGNRIERRRACIATRVLEIHCQGSNQLKHLIYHLGIFLPALPTHLPIRRGRIVPCAIPLGVSRGFVLLYASRKMRADLVSHSVILIVDVVRVNFRLIPIVSAQAW